jgi:RimJ/RimL family protein N-acetyltransferase
MAGFSSRTEEAHAAHWHKIMADADNILRTVVVDGEVAGNMVSFMMDGVREVGYWIGREFWGRGIASSALKQFLQEVKFRPLYAHAVKTNRGSIRMLEKCGFALISKDAAEVIYRLD